MRRVPVHAGGGQQQAAEVRGGGQVHAVRLPEDRLSGDPPLPRVSAQASINVLIFRYVPRSRKFTELERLTNILKRHNVDCSNMTKGDLFTP